MGSDNGLEAVEGHEIHVQIEEVVEHLAQKAVEDKLHPDLLRKAAHQFFTELFKNIGKGDSELAAQGIDELADKLEKRMLEILATKTVDVKDFQVSVDGTTCGGPYFEDGKTCR